MWKGLKRGVPFLVVLLLVSVGFAVDGDPPALEWANLRNPILAYPDRMLKDPTVAYHNGYFYLFCSTRFADDVGDDCLVPFYRSRDLQTFEELTNANLPSVGSPSIFYHNGEYIMAFQKSVLGADPDYRRLFYATSEDLIYWCKPRPLAHELHPTLRCIDATLAHHSGRYILGYKAWQVFYVSEARALDGPWSEPERAWPGGPFDWAENYQFVKIDDSWRMIATSRPPEGRPSSPLITAYVGQHEPFAYTMEGDGTSLLHWARWGMKRHLEIPIEDWNQIMHSNSAVLLDLRVHDGFFYLFYAGANDGETFDGRGHAKIGVARSTDLIHWEPPGI